MYSGIKTLYCKGFQLVSAFVILQLLSFILTKTVIDLLVKDIEFRRFLSLIQGKPSLIFMEKKWVTKYKCQINELLDSIV